MPTDDQTSPRGGAACRARRNFWHVLIEAAAGLSTGEKQVMSALAGFADCCGKIKKGVVSLHHIGLELGLDFEESEFIVHSLRHKRLISKDWRSPKIGYEELRRQAFNADPDCLKRLGSDDIDWLLPMTVARDSRENSLLAKSL